MTTFFISHAEAEKDLGKALQALLLAVGAEVHLTDSSGPGPGEAWRQWLLSAVARSDVLVLIATQVSRNLPWVAYEVGVARGVGYLKDTPRVDVLHFAGLARDAVPEVVDDLQAVRGTSEEQVTAWLSSLGFTAPAAKVEEFCAETRRLIHEIDLDLTGAALTGLSRLGVLATLPPPMRAELEVALAKSVRPLTPGPTGALYDLCRTAFASAATRPTSDDLDEWLRYFNVGARVVDRALQLRVRLPLSRDTSSFVFARVIRLRADELLRRCGPDLARAHVAIPLYPSELSQSSLVESPPAPVFVAAEAEVQRLQAALADAQLWNLGAAASDGLRQPLLPLPFVRVSGVVTWELPRTVRSVRLARLSSPEHWIVDTPSVASEWRTSPADLRLTEPGLYEWAILNRSGRVITEGVFLFSPGATSGSDGFPDDEEVHDWLRVARAGGDGPPVIRLGMALDSAHALARDILGRKLPQFGRLGDAHATLGELGYRP
ncbi:MAG: toll/interleukin-1 receptor domain-containing protein [Pseudomonadota bacterium]